VKEEHVYDLIPGYALNCLDQDDELLVAEHLARCATCRAELKEYQAVAEDLPLAMATSQPPARLRENILQQARRSKAEAQKLSPLPQRRRLWSAPAFSFLSLVIVLLLGASNLLLWSRLNAVERQAQDSLRTVTLEATSFSPQATGLLVISVDGQHGTLVVDRLPVLDESHEYQLWLSKDGQRVSGGIFSVDEDGYGAKWIHADDPLASFTQFGVTIEPAGGSPGPTGDKVLGGEL
jgi:anti-sigma-K factor RskA